MAALLGLLDFERVWTCASHGHELRERCFEIHRSTAYDLFIAAYNQIRGCSSDEVSDFSQTEWAVDCRHTVPYGQQRHLCNIYMLHAMTP